MDSDLSPQSVIDDISKPIREYFDEIQSQEFNPDEDQIQLNAPSFGAAEVIEALDSMLSTWVTMGEKVSKFEEMFSSYVDTKSGLMVNSGSSANLVALKSLAQSKHEPTLDKGDQIIVPTVTWSTSVAPIIDIDCEPVFVDIDPRTFNIDVSNVKESITNDTKAIMAVHLLGNPADIISLREICDDHDLILIEDCCEAHGAKVGEQHVGSFGDIGTYSFFFAHHISTIEGGMVVSTDKHRIEEAKPIRAHGWIREMEERASIADEYPKIDDRYLFIKSGLNVRPTEIQAAFGIHQMDKIDEFIDQRRENAKKLRKLLREFDDVFTFQHEHPDGVHSYYGFPLVVRDEVSFSRSDLVSHLESKGIETRPIMGGNLAEQPAFSNYVKDGTEFDVAHDIHKNGIFFGSHHGIDNKRVDYICESIDEFIGNNT